MNIIEILNECGSRSITTMAKLFKFIIWDPRVHEALDESGVDMGKLTSILQDVIENEEYMCPAPVMAMLDKMSSSHGCVGTAASEDVINFLDSIHLFISNGLVRSMEEFTAIDAFIHIYNLCTKANEDVFELFFYVSEAGGDYEAAVDHLCKPANTVFGSERHIEKYDPKNTGTKAGSKNSGTPFPFLTDMIEQAKTYSLPFIGREDVIERTIMILNRKTKHNVIHLGDPGVGKTACTIGLSKKILEGSVPPVLENAKVFSLDLGALMAGTKYRGEMEERVSSMLKYLDSLDNVILYIDEVHLIVGAGRGSDGGADVANLLKPYLASADSNIRVIGATTKEEYRKYIEKDSAFARRFQTIDILEPSIDEAVEILMGLKTAFEKHHNVSYSKDAIKAAVELSAKYVNDRFLPDKAIDVIDETGSRMSIAGAVKVSKADVQDTIAKIAKIPSDNVKENDIERLAKLSDTLKENVFGQDEAAENITEAIQMSKAGLNENDKPIASFLFVGPTGVGKTEIAKTLATSLDVPLVRFDMSEYKDKTAVNKFIGSSAGYVGYEDGGLLVNAIKDKPSCVLLLDEIEKAHPEIFDVLLQIMDNATLTDNKGRVADFKNVVLIMTSNAGARNMTKSSIGFGNNKGTVVNVGAMDDAVNETFSPEFRGRLTKVVKFNGMSDDMAALIAKKQLNLLALKLKAKGVKLTYNKDVVDAVIADGNATVYGGREIIKAVDRKVKPLFVKEVLFGSLKNGGTATLTVENGEFHITSKGKTPRPSKGDAVTLT